MIERRRLARIALAGCVVLVLLVGIVPAFAPPGAAQHAAVPAILAGEFRYPHDAAHAQRIVQGAVEPRISELPFFMQGFARARMRDQLQVAGRLTIEVAAARVSVTYVGARTSVVASPVPGSTSTTDAGGATVPVTQRLSGGWLEQRFELESGTMTRLFSCEPDGHVLHQDTTITSPRLGAPIRFRLDYLRVTP